MQGTTEIHRRALGCGHLPAAPSFVPVMPWQPSGMQGERLKLCAGYTARLPEVEEISRLRMHWKGASLGIVLRGERLADHAQAGIEIMEGQVSRLERYLMTPKSEGGGGR